VLLGAGTGGAWRFAVSLGALFGCSASAGALLFKSGEGTRPGSLAAGCTVRALLLPFMPAVDITIELSLTSSKTVFLMLMLITLRTEASRYKHFLKTSDEAQESHLLSGLCQCHTHGLEACSCCASSASTITTLRWHIKPITSTPTTASSTWLSISSLSVVLMFVKKLISTAINGHSYILSWYSATKKPSASANIWHIMVRLHFNTTGACSPPRRCLPECHATAEGL